MPILSSFAQKKREILRQLSIPDDAYDDLSPKGSVDAEIRDFVDEINKYEGLVTTSSCSGRISVFLEGHKSSKSVEDNTMADAPNTSKDENAERQNVASDGGKGGGGRWLYVSHQSLESSGLNRSQLLDLFGLRKSANTTPFTTSQTRFIHLKFEPMILHILAASISDAQKVLSAAQQAGFRESGMASIQGQDGPVMVAIRTTGLGFDNVIGVLQDGQHDFDNEILLSLVDASYLAMLVSLTNEKFKVNTERTLKFQQNLHDKYVPLLNKKYDWEDADVRRERKRAEGLRRREELKGQAQRRAELSTNTETQDLLNLALNED
jgi:tRNA wybutosine-synthesizing protein 3